jgi:tripartite-type tricarboxylate transporter receptor subunit TctC
MALQPYRSALPYKSPDDYRAVINLVRQPLVLAVRADAPWTSLQAFLDAARGQPGRLRAGLPGAGTIADVNLDLLGENGGPTFARVHFNSAPDAVRALLGGDVEAVVVGPPGLISPVRAGTARVLGAFEAERNANFPDAPTFREVGHDITLGGYFFVIAPKDTPDRIVETLHSVFKKAMESEQFRTITSRSGFVLDYQGPDDLRRRLADDYALFGRLVGP